MHPRQNPTRLRRFDMERLARGEAAVIEGVAVGGSAHRGGAIRPGDKLVYVDSSDISKLLKMAVNERNKRAQEAGAPAYEEEDESPGLEELELIQSVVLGQKGDVCRPGRLNGC